MASESVYSRACSFSTLSTCDEKLLYYCTIRGTILRGKMKRDRMNIISFLIKPPFTHPVDSFELVSSTSLKKMFHSVKCLVDCSFWNAE